MVFVSTGCNQALKNRINDNQSKIKRSLLPLKRFEIQKFEIEELIIETERHVNTPEYIALTKDLFEDINLIYLLKTSLNWYNKRSINRKSSVTMSAVPDISC